MVALIAGAKSFIKNSRKQIVIPLFQVTRKKIVPPSSAERRSKYPGQVI